MRAHVALAGAVILVMGCSSAPTVVGSWTLESTVRDKPSKGVVTFEADGGYRSEATVGHPGDAVTFLATTKGRWSLEGGKLKVRLTDVDWSAVGAPPQESQLIHETFLTQRDRILQEYNAAPAEPITWKGTDEFSIPGGKAPLVYRRR